MTEHSKIKSAWEKTKEFSADAWDTTKEVSAKAWDKTKELSSDAWDATKEAADKVGDKLSNDENHEHEIHLHKDDTDLTDHDTRNL